MDQLSPMMMQYVAQKQKRPDCLLFFRLGDFYELFFDDAVLASKELEITLTSRDCGQAERAPMCGVPYHAAESYISKLISKNYKIAICEQMEDPALAKGLVKRDVIRVITPGTVTDTRSLNEGENNFIVSVFQKSAYYGLAACDITTGTFEADYYAAGAAAEKLADAVALYHPAELICNQTFAASPLASQLQLRASYAVSVRPDEDFSPAGYQDYLDIGENSQALWGEAAAGLLAYIKDTQQQIPPHLHRLHLTHAEPFMMLDQAARRNLELTETLRDHKRRGSLLWTLDKCQTAMGSRLLRRWVEQPLLDPHDINRRLDAVAELAGQFIARQELRDILNGMYDIERLSAKVAMGQVNPHDLLQLAAALNKMPALKRQLAEAGSAYLKALDQSINPLPDCADLLTRALDPDAPVTLHDGGIIRAGYSTEVDQLRELATNGNQWILDLESREKAQTGIKNLKVGYNKVFGYYLEVSKGNLPLVPDRYLRKQTLVNCERFITEELKGMEDSILSARQRSLDLEYQTFVQLREQIKLQADILLQTSSAVAQLDVLQSLAETADRENYVRPLVDRSAELEIKEGRHPVVEKMLPAGAFVPNDCDLNQSDACLLLLTGPNMAGKSTYMRQTALIVLLAQMGSFVPAKSAHIGVTDRIFTRIGASDDLAGGDSTFMVEMKEIAHILNTATRSSLLILDEIGRGTSTYDGLSIAWAIVEALTEQQHYGCRTLFATHYHELVDLEKTLPGLVNYHSAVQQSGQDILFLHRILPGGSDESYGIEVARLAGVPQTVVSRARDLLRTLEEANSGRSKLRIRKQAKQLQGQQDLFSTSLQLRDYDRVIEALQKTDPQTLTPLDALNRLNDLVQLSRSIKLDTKP
ncbi:DNA mismatch repair protein MutS [Oscillospiraceae bacterium HV4-5-C5C]|nr:DNA mismatch repair protein MutS [Oscillospiraceae bacterium HV4-5-C5C]